MKRLLYAATAALFMTVTAKAGTLEDCIALATDAVMRMLPDSRDIDPRMNPAYVEALLRHALAGMNVQCAKRECRRDVRACKDVALFERDRAVRLQEMNKIAPTR